MGIGACVSENSYAPPILNPSLLNRVSTFQISSPLSSLSISTHNRSSPFYSLIPSPRYPSNSAPFTGPGDNSWPPNLRVARSPTRNTTPREPLRESPTQSCRDRSSTFGSDCKPSRTERSGSTRALSIAFGRSRRNRARARRGICIGASW